MARLQRLDHEIAYEKQILFLLFAAGLGIIGWLFSNAESVAPRLLYIAGGALVADGGILAILHRRIKNKMQEIEHL